MAKRVAPPLMKRFVVALLITCLPAAVLSAQTTETMADRSLKQLVDRQRELFAEAAKRPDYAEDDSFKAQLQEVSHGYERLLQDNPKFAAAYAAYGYMLSKVDMRKESAALLLKANELDPEIPLVKNQLGNLLAEDGKPLQAVNYYLSAIKLAPTEPLYHYQLGTLLAEARDDFVQSGEWTRAAVDHAMIEAFRRAAELAPDRFEFVYRYGESFYDVLEPDWNEALKVWSGLEARAATPIERQTLRLHLANVRLKMEQRDEARSLLATVTDPALAKQKQKLVAQLDSATKK